MKQISKSYPIFLAEFLLLGTPLDIRSEDLDMDIKLDIQSWKILAN